MLERRVWAMRRVEQDGRTVRVLHENASRCSARQATQRGAAVIELSSKGLRERWDLLLIREGGQWFVASAIPRRGPGARGAVSVVATSPDVTP